jgi:carboxyl-terminal processing protease
MKLTYKQLRTRKALAGILVIAVLGAWCIAHSRPVQPGSSLSITDRAAVFDEVWQLVADKYYDPNYNGVDWKAARARYRPQLDDVAAKPPSIRCSTA